MMMSAPVATPTFSAAPAYLAFAAFGSLWGVWGAALPQIRDQAGVTDGQLGTALLFVGVGALPAMLLTGRASDRWGRRVPAAGVVSLALAGMVLALIARGPSVSAWRCWPWGRRPELLTSPSTPSRAPPSGPVDAR